MNYIPYKQRLLSQNFLRDPKLIAHIVGLALFGKMDTVIDIGAGQGAITAELATRVNKVIAVEVDPDLAVALRKKFLLTSNIEVVNDDILHFSMPTQPYKVFSNVPFHITADVIHKLTQFSVPPEEAYLIVQREAAQKYAGSPKETLASVNSKPWFCPSTIYQFKRNDFFPEPTVDSVLLKLVRNKEPLITRDEEILYRKFLSYSFTRGKDLKTSLDRIFTYEQWKRLAHANNFPIHVKATDLPFPAWLSLFKYLVKGVDPKKYKILL